MAGQVLVANLASTNTGDEALETAVREYATLVYRVAYSVLRNHHDAEDATQETFIKVLKYRRKLTGIEDQRTWLARIAWRVAVSKRKKVSEVPMNEVDASALISSEMSADAEVLNSEMNALLAPLIAGLPRQLQDVVTLSTVREMSNADIAEVLDIPEAAVRSRLFRARQLLKQKLSGILEKKHGT